jgi:lipopolysaccharide transport system permease protein
LAKQLAKRDISAQYRQSFLGFFWLFITPIITAGVWIFLSSSGTITLNNTGIPYPVYAFSGTLIWSIIIESINGPLTSTIGARDILSKINFPKEALILSAIYKLFFNSFIKVILIIIIILAFGLGLHWSLFLFPVSLMITVLIGTTIGLFITPLGLLYSDISRLITMVLSLFMYITPVVYAIPSKGIMKTIMELNPLTAMVDTIRATATGQNLDYFGYFVALGGISVILFCVGLIIYRGSIPVIIERLGV